MTETITRAVPPIPVAGTARVASEGRGRRGRFATGFLWIGAILAVAVVVGVLVFYLGGGRWFIVETPSMGRTAPVGTLIIDSPTTVDALRVGDIITFHPPTAPASVYSHRITAITPTGLISTRGDINGSADPWALRNGDVIGKVISVLPGVGWLVRATPLLLIGFVAVWFLSRYARNPTRRASYRVVGFCVAGAAVTFFLRPFVGIVLLGETVTSAGVHATVVSTGLLPIQVTAVGGTHVQLVSGAVGQLTTHSFAADGQYQFASSLDLPFLGWVIYGLICALPLLWCLIVGLPPAQDELAA